MATIMCPDCDARESDGRPHDRETYMELCVRCARAMMRIGTALYRVPMTPELTALRRAADASPPFSPEREAYVTAALAHASTERID